MTTRVAVRAVEGGEFCAREKVKSGSLTTVPKNGGRVRDDNLGGGECGWSRRILRRWKKWKADPSPPSPRTGAGFGMTTQVATSAVEVARRISETWWRIRSIHDPWL